MAAAHPGSLLEEADWAGEGRIWAASVQAWLGLLRAIRAPSQVRRSPPPARRSALGKSSLSHQCSRAACPWTRQDQCEETEPNAQWQAFPRAASAADRCGAATWIGLTAEWQSAELTWTLKDGLPLKPQTSPARREGWPGPPKVTHRSYRRPAPLLQPYRLQALRRGGRGTLGRSVVRKERRQLPPAQQVQPSGPGPEAAGRRSSRAGRA